jgi:hypothetical protein
MSKSLGDGFSVIVPPIANVPSRVRLDVLALVPRSPAVFTRVDAFLMVSLWISINDAPLAQLIDSAVPSFMASLLWKPCEASHPMV